VAVAEAEAVPVSARGVRRGATVCALLYAAPLLVVVQPSNAWAVTSQHGCSCGVVYRATDSEYVATVRRARAAVQRGEWSSAADLWRDALLLDGRVAAHWLAMGDALAHAERRREAVAAYERAMQLDAGLAREGSWNVALSYARMGDHRQAVRWLEQALRAGVSVARVRREETFEPYRDDPRLRSASRLPARLRGRGMKEGARATT
jgi:tetratricopeptide (TPR) repeat protein